MRLFVTVGLIVLLAGAIAVAGCTDTMQKPGAVPQVQKQTIKVSGSTTVLPIAQKAAEAYMATHPNADIQVTGGGSGVGVQQIGEKSVDIGMSSRDLKAAENTKYPNLVKHIVAKDGIAIVVNPKNEIRGIQAATVADI